LTVTRLPTIGHTVAEWTYTRYKDDYTLRCKHSTG